MEIRTTREWVWFNCVFASSRVPVDGWTSFEDGRPYCFGGSDGVTDAVLLDLDADGLPEIIGDEPYWSPDDGRILIAPGFAIPFADDSRW
jgi:hypothetical protein